jgi:hypothetical protein
MKDVGEMIQSILRKSPTKLMLVGRVEERLQELGIREAQNNSGGGVLERVRTYEPAVEVTQQTRLRDLIFLMPVCA